MIDIEEMLRVNREAQKRILAVVIAQTYHGRPCSEDYIFGEATGGSVFLECAEAALSKLEELAK